MSQYQELCDAYRVFLADDPNACVQLGLEEKLDQLPDPSISKVHATREQAAGLRRRAESLLPELEDFHQRYGAAAVILFLHTKDRGLRPAPADLQNVPANTTIYALVLPNGSSRQDRDPAGGSYEL